MTFISLRFHVRLNGGKKMKILKSVGKKNDDDDAEDERYQMKRKGHESNALKNNI